MKTEKLKKGPSEEERQKVNRLKKEIRENRDLNQRLVKAMTLLRDHLSEERSEQEKSLLIAQLDALNLPENY